MRKNYSSKVIVWLGWCVIWILMNKVLYWAGLATGKTAFQMVVDCFLSIFAAEVMCYSTVLSVLTIGFLTIKMVVDFGFVSILWYVMDIGLFVVTFILTPRAKNQKNKK